MEYIIGIDQGGTKTHAALAKSDGTILGIDCSPGGEHHVVGFNVQSQYLLDSIENLINKFNVSYGQIAAIAGGLTGIDFPGEKELFENYIIEKLGVENKVRFENDVIATMKGGNLNSFGAAICCGTAANCAVIAPDGRQFIYGFLLEEELMGAGAIRRAALTAIRRAETGRIPHTLLTESILEKSGHKTVLEFLQALAERKIQKSVLADIPIEVSKCAYKGDSVAMGILQDLGYGLADAIIAKVRDFDMCDVPFDIVLAGSVFKGPGDHLYNSIKEKTLETCSRANVIKAQYEPVVGGVIMALEQVHGSITEDILDNLKKSAENLGLILGGVNL